ncbi:hypothetical protein TTHERM_00699800 (macronuclear) [Tetrahymena thermophila SB210]|uniref:Uncharacterized protein n=1 Tax=Tetrahymena thermophila (strain SB210) TaxID=312017 RepID=Q22LS0_TETTS|nr:hypothetical protein TTHERM_00699800 [Tetrahymena thermophila SB210]EAR86196.2 hypothetical protein TTHERM_00699800 [Tetrahymena thermophila SB210]|eukprot:XP_976791.2 hypothetical protein TTHERM_00699800 [Tetrahymena thermophila SB210]
MESYRWDCLSRIQMNQQIIDQFLFKQSKLILKKYYQLIKLQIAKKKEINQLKKKMSYFISQDSEESLSSFSDLKINQISFKNEYLEACLNLKQPDYVLEFESNCLNENNKKILLLQKQSYLQLNAFDKKQNMQKQLYIFSDQVIIEFYIRLFQCLPRKDLIYPIEDQYYLDRNQNFYVFEIQCPKIDEENENLFEFNKNNSKINQSISQKLSKYFFDQLIEFDEKEIINYFQKNKQQRLNIFDLTLRHKQIINQTLEQINLRSFAETEIKTPLNFCFSQFEQVQGNNIKIDGTNKLVNEESYLENQPSNEGLCIQNSEEEEDQECSFEEEIEQLRELHENIFIAMKKENLITNIKKYYSDLLKYHQEDIFILLQQHPKYNNFEVQLYTSEYFQLKCTKDNNSMTLILKKYNSFQMIQEEEKFINQRVINTNNLILTETIPLGRFYYLLTEVKYFKPVREIFFYHSIEELIKHSRNDKQLKLQVVKLLIEISYELLTKYNIKITNINPSKILIQGNDENIQKFQTFGIIIQQISFEQFDQKYENLIDCYELQSVNNYYPNAIKLKFFIDEFFTYLNLNQSQEVARLYVDIIEHISLLKLVEVNGGLKIYGYNKLHKDFFYSNMELIKYQQKVSSLQIKLEDYIKLSENNLIFDCKNQFLEQNQRLSPEQQEEFLKHYNIFESYFEKMELVKSDIQNKNQLQLMLELKNMFNICLDCNIFGELDFQIGIIQNTSQFFNKFDKKFLKIDSESDYILRDVSQILQVKMNLSGKKMKIYFALVQQKIFFLSIDQNDTLIYQEHTKEMFSLINIQRFIKRIQLNLVNKNQYHQIFKFLQKFDNLQRLTLDLLTIMQKIY